MEQTQKKTAASLPKEKWDAIVIGSGIGGMTCAGALAKYGWKVLVLEQHYVLGGCTHMFTRKGYSWDVGIHCLGQMQKDEVPRKVFDWLSHDKVEMEFLGEFYDIIYMPDGYKLQVPSDRQQQIAVLKKEFPQDAEAIDKYFQLINDAADALKYFFASRLLPKWSSPLLERLGHRWWLKTTDEVLRSIISNSKLRSVLTAQWGYYGSTPQHSSFGVHAITMKHYWGGGYYPVGGSKTIAEAFTEALRENGGDALTRTPVKEILTKKGKAYGVRLESGEEIHAPVVISSVGAKATVERLMTSEYQNSTWGRDIQGLEQSPTYVTLYMGFEGDIAGAGATRANQWHYETWDMEESALWNIEDPQAIAPFLYISFPSIKDPHHHAGPAQKHTGEMITFVPWEPFAKWKHTRRGLREQEYMAYKKQIEERFVAHFARKHPALMPFLKYYELSTPLSTAHFIRAPQGAIYGLAPTPRRMQDTNLNAATPVKGLYLAGCDVGLLGVAGAMIGGLLTAGRLDPRVIPKLI